MSILAHKTYQDIMYLHYQLQFTVIARMEGHKSLMLQWVTVSGWCKENLVVTLTYLAGGYLDYI